MDRRKRDCTQFNYNDSLVSFVELIELYFELVQMSVTEMNYWVQLQK